MCVHKLRSPDPVKRKRVSAPRPSVFYREVGSSGLDSLSAASDLVVVVKASVVPVYHQMVA